MKYFCGKNVNEKYIILKQQHYKNIKIKLFRKLSVNYRCQIAMDVLNNDEKRFLTEAACNLKVNFFTYLQLILIINVHHFKYVYYYNEYISEISNNFFDQTC